MALILSNPATSTLPSRPVALIAAFAELQHAFYPSSYTGLVTASDAMRLLSYGILVLGIVLGDLLDKNLRRGLVLSDGDLLPFFTRPLSALLATSATTAAGAPCSGYGRWTWSPRASASASPTRC